MKNTSEYRTVTIDSFIYLLVVVFDLMFMAGVVFSLLPFLVPFKNPLTFHSLITVVSFVSLFFALFLYSLGKRKLFYCVSFGLLAFSLLFAFSGMWRAFEIFSRKMELLPRVMLPIVMRASIPLFSLGFSLFVYKTKPVFND